MTTTITIRYLVTATLAVAVGFAAGVVTIVHNFGDVVPNRVPPYNTLCTGLDQDTGRDLTNYDWWRPEADGRCHLRDYVWGRLTGG